MSLADPLHLRSPAEWARRLAIGTAGGLFMGATGAFGTFVESPLPLRLVGWVAMFWAGTAIYSVVLHPVIVRGRRIGAPLWACVAAGLVLATAPMTAATFVITRYILHTGLTQHWYDRYWQVLLVVTPVIGGYIAVRELLQKQAAPAAPPPAEQPPPPRQAPFLARLPSKLGKDLLCLEMEDHYVRAHTALGSDLILMRLRDAVAELDGIDGMQTHRSWWVARAAVEEAERADGALRLKLRGGLTVPVARAKAAELKAAGWL